MLFTDNSDYTENYLYDTDILYDLCQDELSIAICIVLNGQSSDSSNGWILYAKFGDMWERT